MFIFPTGLDERYRYEFWLEFILTFGIGLTLLDLIMLAARWT